MTTLRALTFALTLGPAAAVLSGCPNGVVPAPADALQDVEAVLALADARLVGLESLVAEARVSYYSDDLVRKGKVSLLARRPARPSSAACAGRLTSDRIFRSGT